MVRLFSSSEDCGLFERAAAANAGRLAPGTPARRWPATGWPDDAAGALACRGSNHSADALTRIFPRMRRGVVRSCIVALQRPIRTPFEDATDRLKRPACLDSSSRRSPLMRFGFPSAFAGCAVPLELPRSSDPATTLSPVPTHVGGGRCVLAVFRPMASPTEQTFHSVRSRRPVRCVSFVANSMRCLCAVPDTHRGLSQPGRESVPANAHGILWPFAVLLRPVGEQRLSASLAPACRLTIRPARRTYLAAGSDVGRIKVGSLRLPGFIPADKPCRME